MPRGISIVAELKSVISCLELRRQSVCTKLCLCGMLEDEVQLGELSPVSPFPTIVSCSCPFSRSRTEMSQKRVSIMAWISVAMWKGQVNNRFTGRGTLALLRGRHVSKTWELHRIGGRDIHLWYIYAFAACCTDCADRCSGCRRGERRGRVRQWSEQRDMYIYRCVGKRERWRGEKEVYIIDLTCSFLAMTLVGRVIIILLGVSSTASLEKSVSTSRTYVEMSATPAGNMRMYVAELEMIV
jgi:hypothetical protein